MSKDQAYLAAEKKIQKALKSGATELDLSSMDLTELPKSIGQLTQLKELKLGINYSAKDKKPNRLTTLPESLGQLTQLQELDLSNNQLATLPKWIGQLTQLQTLNLSSNELTALPDSLEQLTQLQTVHLSFNHLTALPDSLGQLTQLQNLDISSNQMTALPETLRRFTQLQSLTFMHNHLSKLPEWLGNFKQLQELTLYDNLLTELPVSFGDLIQLVELNLNGNSFSNIPICIRQIKSLRYLYLNSNLLVTLPDWIGELTLLSNLQVFHNHLEQLPNSIGNLNNLRSLILGIMNGDNNLTDLPTSLAQLENLEEIRLEGNPLNTALKSAYDAGLDELKAYLRSLENAEPLYEAKLVLVGEGNVGKTTLLKALKGLKEEAPQENEPTTHGIKIDIQGLLLPHPTKDGVQIQLNAWDFGGQDVYRVTHQFFFSRRSLYLLVWEPRRGVQAGQVEDWLNMIRLRVGDDARVLIVSTHCKTGERIARIDKPVLQQQYGDMIVGFYEVDSLVPDEHNGEMVGIAALKKVIAEQASQLEQMGMPFSPQWKSARDELIAYPEPRVSYAAFSEICAKHELSPIATKTLAQIMHDLGYIVYYSDDEQLCDDVVLQPQWLTKAIGFVLEDRVTAEREGILPDKHLFEVWHDHSFKGEPRYDPALYPFFLRLMEKYDVSYRLPDGKASLVAQHVPQVRPELPWLPDEKTPDNLRRIAMVCSMEEDPPGLVPWMIVRTHDYAVEQTNAAGSVHSLHWQKGMFLRHAPHGEAMLEKRGREFHVYTQSIYPEYFMNVLQETLQKMIKDNWPGLEDRYRFAVPCPEVIDGQPCKGRFNIDALRQFLVEGDATIRCQNCSKKQFIAELLLGFEERPVDLQLREINERLAGLDSRIANYFMATMRAIADEAKNGPRLFTFRSREAGLSPKQLFARPLELQLWCEAESCQHPVIESGKGVYTIDQPYGWVKQIAPYANIALKVLATVAPIAAPAINVFFGAKTTEKWDIDRHLDLANAIIGKLPDEIKASDHDMASGKMLSEPERSGILALHRFLNEADPTQEKLGLHRVPTYTGDYRWLCDQHYAAWQPNIPDMVVTTG
jgi:Leucine-rich repeat (LRR) protein